MHTPNASNTPMPRSAGRVHRLRRWLLRVGVPLMSIAVMDPGDVGCTWTGRPSVNPSVKAQVGVSTKFAVKGTKQDGNGNTVVKFGGITSSFYGEYVLFAAKDGAGINCNHSYWAKESMVCAGRLDYSRLSTQWLSASSYDRPVDATIKTGDHLLLCTLPYSLDANPSVSACEELKY